MTRYISPLPGGTQGGSKFDGAQKLADAVLYEGYLLYPYRASALKNQFRWQFGVVVPPGCEAGEPSAVQTECLLKDPGSLQVRVRFLQLQVREADGWEEGFERCFDFENPIGTFPIEVEGPISARLEGSLQELEGGLQRLRLRVENRTPGRFETRCQALLHSLVGLHTLVALEKGSFVSLADPPPEASGAAAGCHNLHTWPVLIGSDLLLSSPIILPDQPAVAPQSPGDMFDATEIDELLTLRTMTLTDQEKSEACRTDRRAREIVERCDHLPPEWLDRLHASMHPVLRVGGVPIGKDSRVRLRPRRQADAQDMFLAGRTARVHELHQDYDGAVHLSVRLDDDDLHDCYGRYYYFHPEEVEPL